MDDFDADAGTEVGRFDDQRITEGSRLLEILLLTVLEFAHLDLEPGNDRDVMVFQDLLHDDLVLADCRADHAAGSIGKIHHLQKALQGAVFAAGAVHDRKSDIDLLLIMLEQAVLDGMQVNVVSVLDERDLAQFGNEIIQIRVVREVEQKIAGIHVLILGNVYGDHFIFILIQGLNDLVRTDTADFVLAGLPAEKYRNSNFHVLPPLLSL